MVHFKDTLVQQAIQMMFEDYTQAKELYEFIDASNDLCRIHLAKQNLLHGNGEKHARQLNSGLREKYPIIAEMLNIIDTMKSAGGPLPTNNSTRELTVELQELQQDHFEILCHVLLKKNCIEQIEDFISHLG